MIEPFLSTFGGGKLYPLGPNPADINIEDIAHSLSNLCRYNGHTSEFWSVAAHSIEICKRLLEREYSLDMAFAGLMHDASEAYLQDIPRPIKPLVLGYAQWEENLEYTIANKFKMIYPYPSPIHQFDMGLALDEIANFFPEGSEAWKRAGIERRDLHPVLRPKSPLHGKTEFLKLFRYLKP